MDNYLHLKSVAYLLNGAAKNLLIQFFPPDLLVSLALEL